MKANTKVIMEKSSPSWVDEGMTGKYEGLFLARGRVYKVIIDRHGGKPPIGASKLLDTFSGVYIWERAYEPEIEQEAINSMKGKIDYKLNVEKEVQFYKDMLNKMGVD
jgi:hypothetical protein